MKLIILLSMFSVLVGCASAQTATFYTQQKSAVYSTDTTDCTGCNSGITEYDISEQDTFDCTKYTMVAFQAYGNATECGYVRFTGGGRNLGNVPLCVGSAYNIINNGKVSGTAIVDMGNLTNYVSGGDTLAPSIICITIR